MRESDNAPIHNQDELWEAMASIIAENFFQKPPEEAQAYIEQWTT